MHSFLRFSISTKVTLALSIGLGILLVLATVGLYSAGEFFKTGQEVRQLLQLRGSLDQINLDMERAESMRLRYRLSGAKTDSEEFGRLSARVIGAIKELRATLTAPDQQARLDELERAVQAHFELDAERAPDDAAARQKAQDIVGAIGESARQSARDSAERVETLVKLLLTLALWGGAIAVALLVWTVFVINRYEGDRRRAESDLANARERLDFALEGSNSAAWDWDLHSNEIYLSAGWQQMLGAEARDTTATVAALLDLVHPDDVGRVQAAFKDALSGSSADYQVEHRVRRTNGDWIWIVSGGRVVRRDDAGRALRITGTNRDVTGSKAMEMALQEHDLQLQMALALAGMVRWDWDVAADAFVWPEEPRRIAGPAPGDGYRGLRDMVHPDDLARFTGTLNQVAQSGQPYKDEYRLVRTDGAIVWVAARGYSVREADGKVVRVIGVAQDVSEIKQAEEALRASERELRLITDAVPAFISYADASQVVRFCNKALATFVGLQPGELIGRPLRELYTENVYNMLQPYARRALAGERVQFQRRQAARDGSMVDFDVTYIPRRGILGEVEGFYALLTDITELKRLDRMKTEFVSTVSHELRTPLTSIRGSLGILAGGVAGPLSDKVRGFIDIAKDNCERLIRLINDILDMEKIESGKMAFQLQAIDLMQLVERTVKANEGFAAQHGVRLQIVAAEPSAKVQGDGDRLAQVLTNLISNACKFSPAQGSVDIAVSPGDGRVRVAVTDHGPGISDTFRQRIFQKFSQEDSSDMRQKGGTGLGLSISRAIVEGLGGEIGFDTEIGKGSTFYFWLPQCCEPVAPQSAGSLARARLLVCGSNAEAGARLEIMADQAGYDADIARTTAEARLLLRERHYVAMTLDLDLSGQDALALLREVRANPATAGLPVIALCAVWEEGKRKLGREGLGVIDWLAKPIDEQRLLAGLRAVHSATGRPRILHVEDSADVRNVVAAIGRDVAEFEAAGSVAEARARLAREKFDLVLLDLGLPDGSGWELLPQINALVPPLRVVIFSAQDAHRDGETLPYAFLVKSQTSEQRLIEVIREAVNSVA